jgi:acetate kinase
VNTIVLHIGNGVSACAVRGGESIDTSMGMTPLEGLVMGTRSGDIDPGILFHLHRQDGMSVPQMDDLLNRRSGLLGLAGSSDMRDVLASAARGEPRARLAVEVYCHRLRHYVGAYYAQLGRLDAVAFTAGVGENAAEIRARSLAGLEPMGIVVDPERNASPGDDGRISTDDSSVAVLVIPTNEELEIARQTFATIEDFR